MSNPDSTFTQLFGPWDPPPQFVSSPADPKRAEVIQKLAQFAVKNGASFVELIKAKQRDNSEYQFLFGGDGSDYYRWVLYVGCQGLPPDQPLPLAQQQAQHQSQQQQPQQQATCSEPQAAPVQDVEGLLQQTLATCDPQVKDGFAQVLAALSGSKESIKQSQQWFMACLPYAPGMAAAVALHVRNLADYDKQLHVLYLANDILLKRLSQRPPGSAADGDEVAQAFKPWLPGILGMAFSTGGRTDQVKERLLKILTFWADRKLYDKDTMQQLEAALLSGDPNAMLQPPAPKQGGRPSKRKWDQPAAPQPTAAANAAANAQPIQPAHQMTSPTHPPFTHLDPYSQPQGSSQPPYQDAAPQQPGFSQSYQQHPDMQSMPAGSYGMQNSNVPPGSAGMHSAHSTPWQQSNQGLMQAQHQQQPWGMPGQAPAYPTHGQYPQQGAGSMPMSHQMPGTGPGGQYMHQLQMQPQQQMPPHMYMQHPQQQMGGPAWYPPPGQGPRPGQAPGGPFPGMPPQSAPDLHAPPPDLAPSAPAAPAKPKADPMSFPPGLIPQLVAEKLKTDPPYSPLSPLDIDRAGLPASSEPDSYLQSRIDRFYAELQDWRPGVQQTDAGKHRKAVKEEEEEEKPRVPFNPRAQPPPADGSFSGGGGGGLGFANAGLGFHEAAEEQPANAFDTYREQRSGRYKSSLSAPPPASFG